MKTTSFRIAMLGALTGLAICAASPGRAQVPSAEPPYNTANAAQIPLANRTTATYTGATQFNLDKQGLVCRLHQNLAGSSSGTPSTTYGIQILDAVSGVWLQQAVSGAVTTAGDYDLYIKSGAVATSVPSNTAIFGLPVPNAWRAFMTVGGTGAPSVTSGVNCGYLR